LGSFYDSGFYKLDNLVAILDKNGIQATGPIAQRYDSNPHSEKWRAFGWQVFEIDGHNIGQISDALDKADKVEDKPTMIVAKYGKKQRGAVRGRKSGIPSRHYDTGAV